MSMFALEIIAISVAVVLDRNSGDYLLQGNMVER